MSDSKKTSDSCSTNIPPPCDPFTRFSQPWPRMERDEDNPFIQFRRFADDSLGSIFSGFPRFFNSLQQPRPSWQDDFQKQIEEHIKKNAEMEEGIRKQIEQNFEEMRQAFHQQQAIPNDVERGLAPMPPWWQKGEGTKCPALKGDLSENAQNCPAMFDREGNAKTELATQPPKGPWWTTGETTKCPALNEDISHRALKCPALFDKMGSPKTELDAYEHDAPLPDNRSGDIDTSPYAWSSGLGWDGKIKKSLEQAHKHNRHSWANHERLPQKAERSMPADRDINSRVRHRRSSAWLDPFTTPQNTIPWLILSPYSPVYLCNPDQPSALEVRFRTGVDEPFSMSVMRYKDRSFLTGDLDKKVARALPWADAFEDLISLEQTGKMIDRDASTFRTPKTWIHDMVKKGSLGPAWGFNDDGQLAQKQEFPRDTDLARWMRARKAARSNRRPEEVIDAVRKQQAQTTSEAKAEAHPLASSQRDLMDLELLNQDRLRAESKWQTSTDSAPKGTKVMDLRTSPDAAAERNRSSFPNARSLHDRDTKDAVVSTMIRTETATLPDGSILTTRVLKRRFADGREEQEESVNTTPSSGSMTIPRSGANGANIQAQISRSEQDSQRHQHQWKLGEQQRMKQDPPAGQENEGGLTLSLPKMLPKEGTSSPSQENRKEGEGKKRGWFWN